MMEGWYLEGPSLVAECRAAAMCIHVMFSRNFAHAFSMDCLSRNFLCTFIDEKLRPLMLSHLLCINGTSGRRCFDALYRSDVALLSAES